MHINVDHNDHLDHFKNLDKPDDISHLVNLDVIYNLDCISYL